MKIIDAKKLGISIGGLLLSFCVAMIGYGACYDYFTNMPLTHKTTGYILRPFGGKGLYDYYFLDANGDSIYNRANFSGFSNRKYKGGDTVTILYNPMQIEQAIPDNSFNKNMYKYSLLIGIILFIVSLGCLYDTYKNLRSAIEW